MILQLIAMLGPAIALGIGLLVAMVKWPKVWLGTVILSLPVFLFDSGKGFSASEMVLGVFIIGSVMAWIVMKISAGLKLVTWWGDFLIFLFLFLSAFNVVIALLNDVELVGWLSEWSLFFLMLYYFPLREYFGKDERSLKQLLVLLAISTVLMAAYTAWHYKMRSGGGMVYAYQILASRSRLFAPAFVMGLVVGIAAMFHTRSWKVRAPLFLLIMINLGGLLQSFTRSLWVVFAASVVMMMFYLTWRQNIVLAVTSVMILIAGYLAADAWNPRITAIAMRIIESRIESSTQLTGGDYSFETRLIEADAAEQYIKMYPLGGNGLRAPLLSWGPIEQFTWKKSFIHIGYISLMFKLGIPLTLVMIAFVVMFSWRGLYASLRLRDRRRAPPIYRAVAIGMATFLPALYVTILTSGFIDQRYGNVMFGVFFALVTIVHTRATQGSETEGQAAA